MATFLEAKIGPAGAARACGELGALEHSALTILDGSPASIGADGRRRTAATQPRTGAPPSGGRALHGGAKASQKPRGAFPGGFRRAFQTPENQHLQASISYSTPTLRFMLFLLNLFPVGNNNVLVTL